MARLSKRSSYRTMMRAGYMALGRRSFAQGWGGAVHLGLGGVWVWCTAAMMV